MSSTQRYPSPTQAQSGGDGPFYNRIPPTNNSPAPHDQEEALDDLQLRADLAQLIAPSRTDEQSQQREEHGSPHQYDASSDLQAQLQGGLPIHEGSPVDQGLDASAKEKGQRQKVSRACDECRRKKASWVYIMSAALLLTRMRRSDAMLPMRAALSHAQIVEGSMLYAPSVDNR